MNVLLIFYFMLGGFNQRWYIPRGMIGECGRILIGDTDRDGNYEFIIHTYGSQKIYFYELHLPDTWQVDSFSYLYSPLIWDIGDFDLDGLYDLVMQCGSTDPFWVGITIFESPDSFSYPTQEVWRDTVGSALVTPICAYDIDQDGLPEIVKVLGDYIHLHIYESIGDNLYDKIAEITTSSTYNSSSTLAFGDFDLDGRNEFVWGYTGGEYSIWECTGNNSYQEVLLQQLPTLNIKDCFSVSDADGDSKLEFVVKGYWWGSQINAYIFEATGDNTYEIIKTFDFPGGPYYGGYSEAGDVDGDGIPEIVLEACQSVFIIKSAGNDSFYVWDTLPGNDGGSSIAIYDIDGNGLAEIIISGNNQTRIYEYVVGITEATEKVIQGSGLTIYPNPFYDKTMIRCMIPDAGFVIESISLKIYDISGRVVKDLTNNLAPHTLHHTSELLWDGKDENRRQLPNGVYFVCSVGSNLYIVHQHNSTDIRNIHKQKFFEHVPSAVEI